jgi:ADP-heptose:LPS heptosyltransferase
LAADRSMKILVISLAGIGDALLATPLIHELRLNFPGATLDAFVRWGGAKDLLQGNPHLNTVFHKNLVEDGPWEALQILSRLRRRHYDVSLNTYPQGKIQYRLVARFIHARQRLSHRYENHGWKDGWLVNRTVPQDYQRHSVENNMKFLELLGVEPKLARHESEVFLTEAEHNWAAGFVHQHLLVGKYIIGMHVGSSKTKNLALRRWPLENYIALTRQLMAAQPDAAVVLFGGPEEKSDHEIMLREIGHKSVVETTSRNLREATALLAHCQAFVSVDTALMHLAAAMKVPCQFVIETPTFNPTIAPHQRPYVLVRNPMVNGRNLDYYRYDGRDIQGTPDHLRACMKSITVQDVLTPLEQAIRSVAHGTNSDSGRKRPTT